MYFSRTHCTRNVLCRAIILSFLAQSKHSPLRSFFGHSTTNNTNIYGRNKIAKKMSTIRRSKRKCKSDYALADARPRIEIYDNRKVLKAVGSIHSLTNGSDSSDLLDECFRRMNPHIWHQLLPIDLKTMILVSPQVNHGIYYVLY